MKSGGSIQSQRERVKLMSNIIQVPRGEYLVIPYITILQYLESKESNIKEEDDSYES